MSHFGEILNKYKFLITVRVIITNQSYMNMQDWALSLLQ